MHHRGIGFDHAEVGLVAACGATVGPGPSSLRAIEVFLPYSGSEMPGRCGAACSVLLAAAPGDLALVVGPGVALPAGAATLGLGEGVFRFGDPLVLPEV